MTPRDTAFTSPRATKCFQGVLGPRPAPLCWCPSPARQLLPTRAPKFGSPWLAPRAQLVPGEAAWLGRSDFTAAFCSGGCEGSKPEPFTLPGSKQGTKLRFQLLFPALPSACHDLLCLPGPHSHPQHPSACQGRRSHAPSVNEQARHTHTHKHTRKATQASSAHHKAAVKVSKPLSVLRISSLGMTQKQG